MTDGEDSFGDEPTMDLESTASLLGHIRDGSLPARDRLMRRYLDPLRRWARGRLPVGLRDLTDTDDLVQITLLRALDHVDGFEYRKDGAFLAYLRRILQNRIRDEVRRAARRPGQAELPEEFPAAGPSPLEQAMGKQALERYERALQGLRPEQQEAVVLRMELGFTYPEIAAALGSPTPNAARMMVTRGVIRLAEIMDGG
jgi:RNA polymerase sigma-70 factor (ECF subfamily)